MDYILLPSTIEFKDTDKINTTELIITPCHQGYGVTIGNSLRRVLLSSIEGAAVEAMKVNGIQHEFSAIEGIMEDVIEISQNLKQMAIISYSDSPVTLYLTKKGKGEIKAGDFDKNSDIEIINPDLKIATMTDGKKEFNLEIIIDKGLGYVPVSEKENKNLDLGTILIDSFYSPVKDVGYKVENTRVGDVTDYEKVILTIETNGTVSPKETVERATKILMDHCSLILESSDTVVTDSKKKEKKPKKISEEK
ncbi:MAG: DNA-directed RNA polymerase subunit alpha [Candidatus Magasanikbacteria bacterium CG_4_10_14_0_8_um_filter_32_14]|uniref:DNA-directed RNA polymerase subunit alpha n=2 Tax=Candidatus Magasanikiibacteriota TaxID=1752731 RepID=A0A2M7R8T4_9BACT|nr:MAG: DNA-directed RNA polymerase subunit alpha [Candidatus Magasanikbacteria bacterium CG1_02_32_51]PIY93179.1 MAG: DNA-directed RNA polymerase subunit alpha [Candidatus Magasanikbacteria bacterium CG_4_10_14_0_8_um_filter_32_14]